MSLAFQEVFTYFEDTKVLWTAKSKDAPSTVVTSSPSPVLVGDRIRITTIVHKQNKNKNYGYNLLL